MSRKPATKLPLAAIGFLLPNFLGVLGFTLFPVLFSFWMAFTNWTPKPAVRLQYLGLRNFSDLLGARPLDQPHPGLVWLYVFCLVAFVVGGIGLFWKERRALAALLVVGGALGLVGLNPALWQFYTPNDPRFWQYAYNTGYLMLGIPFSIAGSLAMALLLNDELPLGTGRMRAVGALLCLGGGMLTLLLFWGTGHADLGLLGGIFWLIAALGIAFNVVSFRTMFYVPTFTAGVALMILWKALYNPQTGPINVGLRALFHLLNLPFTPPEWLSNVAWAKPALIAMGVWTSIGGTNMLLYLAGLSNVPRELLDAAEVDGAGGWNRFRHVTWPQLAPTTFFISIMAIIGGLQGGFDQARVMTGGGPAGSTTTLSYYIFNKAFQDLDLGYAAAISWTLFAIVFVATALNWRFGRGLEVE